MATSFRFRVKTTDSCPAEDKRRDRDKGFNKKKSFLS